MNSNKRSINGKSRVSDLKTTGSILQRALKSGSLWPDKDEFLDVIYWMRQIIALFTGLAWGIIPFEGLLGIIVFFAINCSVVFFYSSKFQNVDDDEYGGILEIIKEGLFTAFSVFLVSWITVYTAIQKLNK
eukprot:gene18771-20662_t